MQLIVKTDTPATALQRVGQKIKHPHSLRQLHRRRAGCRPRKGQYFENRTPISGEVVCEIARSTAEDIEKALDAAHAAADAWGKTAPAARADVLFKIADRMRGASDRDRHRRDDRQRQADPRDDGRRHAARRSIISATSRAASARRRARSPRSTRRRSPTTSTSRSASSARSSPGTSPSSWPCGSSRRRSPPATASC